MKRLICIILVLCVLFSCTYFVAGAAEVVFEPTVTDMWYDNGVRYGRGIQLKCDEAGENKGNIYVTSEYFYFPGYYGQEHFPIFESSDGGRTYKHISDIYDTEFIQRKYKMAEDGTYYQVPEGEEGATTYKNEWWSMKFQPFLYELPEDIGQLKKGTVLCAGTTKNNNYSAIVLYYSTDGLRTWDYLSTIVEGGALTMGTGTAIWEAFLTSEDGVLYCFYSDERGMTKGGGQRLVYRASTDCVNWGEDVKVCDFEEENPKYRPGMPVVTKMANGKFFLIYEGVNMGNGYMPVYYKTSDDIATWDYKDHGVELPAPFRSGSPYCTTLNDGKIVITTHGTKKIGVNVNNAETNEWYIFNTDIESAYSRALFPMDNGDLLLVSGGAHQPMNGRTLTASVEKIAIDNEIKIVKTTGTEPWGEETPNWGNSVANATDNNPDSFFDGKKDGYILLDLGKEYNVTALGYITRFNFGFRMAGGSFYGSKDGDSWTKLHTIGAAPKNSLTYYVNIEGGSYRYIKYTSNGKEGCNVAEIKVYTSDALNVKINGKFVHKGGDPIVQNGEILVPLRMISEEMGADIAWIATENCVAVILGGKLAMLEINSDKYTFDGEEKKAGSVIEIIEGSTYVPIDVIETVLHCKAEISGSCINISN
ncbi:MAG: discoidin domain-containing protein [Clostridia bacterium]|nr:discoidin domain-containing protein [Clostridia bacterium]